MDWTLQSIVASTKEISDVYCLCSTRCRYVTVVKASYVFSGHRSEILDKAGPYKRCGFFFFFVSLFLQKVWLKVCVSAADLKGGFKKRRRAKRQMQVNRRTWGILMKNLKDGGLFRWSTFSLTVCFFFWSVNWNVLTWEGAVKGLGVFVTRVTDCPFYFCMEKNIYYLPSQQP